MWVSLPNSRHAALPQDSDHGIAQHGFSPFFPSLWGLSQIYKHLESANIFVLVNRVQKSEESRIRRSFFFFEKVLGRSRFLFSISKAFGGSLMVEFRRLHLLVRCWGRLRKNSAIGAAGPDYNGYRTIHLFICLRTLSP